MAINRQDVEHTETTRPLLRQQFSSFNGELGNEVSYGTTNDHDKHLDHDLIHDSLYPDDIFEYAVYWADLPADEQSRWITRKSRQEMRRELSEIRNMSRQSYLEPLRAYLRTYALTGVGFFIEGYVLFSVGNMMPLLKAGWPQCWSKFLVCDEQMIKAIKYMEILGIICGQLIVGCLGDAIGRRWGLIQDAAIMLVGTIMLASMWGTTLAGWTVMYGVAIFVFGLGVGGEYPMTSTTSIEGRQGPDDRSHRGRAVCLAFLMQGWGQLANQLILIIFTVIVNPLHVLAPPYSEHATQLTFRLTFLVASLLLVYFLYLRIFHMKNVDSKVQQNRKATSTSGFDWKGFRFVLSHFWQRLLASSLCWFCSDFAFYGNQVFRNQLLELVTGTSAAQVDSVWIYNLINIGCQLCGYYLTALLIDHKSWGRKRIQSIGFGMLFLLFALVAGAFSFLNQKGTNAKIFQAIYFITNFFVQFGPNSTTFLIAGEIFPVGVRSTAHGFSAAVGKTGALAATISYNYIDDRSKFTFCAIFSLLGLVLTTMFVPDTTGLDLSEMQRAWNFVVDDRLKDYHGIAVHPRHLSWFERIVRGRHDNYDLEFDRHQRVAELRNMYETNKDGLERESNESEEVDSRLQRYFSREVREES